MILEYPVNLHVLSYKDKRTYLLAALFAVGNIALPQLCHFVPGGGLTWLPIFFFTLIAAYKYGVHVGLLTAILSPVINSLLFGMPSAAILPIILIKSIILASTAAYIAHRFKKLSILHLLAVVLIYQTLGAIFQWTIFSDLSVALESLKIGIPGMIVQVVGGYAVLRAMAKL